MNDSRNNKEQELIKKIDKNINELVYDKTSIRKAYNYYHGHRDPEQFRHLEENYGIGTPTSIEFIPLVRKHIDVLIGEYLSTPLMARVSCKDKETLSSIHRDKQLKITAEVNALLKQHLNNTVYSAINGDPKAADIEIQSQIMDLIESLDQNFISEYEIAGQNIVEYISDAKNIDFKNKRKLILIDLLTSGTCYFKVSPSNSKTNINLKILNPLNAFIDRNPESPYLKRSSRAVYREYLTKQQILSSLGNLISSADLEKLEEDSIMGFDNSTSTYVHSYDSDVNDSDVDGYDGILGGYEISPLLPYGHSSSKNFKTYPVYYTEWLQADKEKGEYITNRYEGIRIGESIYIPIGKSEHIMRTADDPSDCSLTINGIFYADRNGDPTSLVLSTANLQDKFDILHFYRDNLIAESGTAGDWLDVAHLPKFLGNNVTERLVKWKAYGKSGVKLYDSSQEGQMVNTAFNGFDDTVKAQAIQGIELAIDRIENTCSGITGVFKERIGGIEQRDAVTNVQVGIKNSSYITKQYYQLMDLMTREMLVDMLDVAKIVYKNGLTGTLVLGERLNKIFTALPEHFTFTDYDVHIQDSAEYIKEEETIKQLTIEFTKGGMVDPDIVLATATAKGLTRLKAEIATALKKKKAEQDQTQQLGSQVEELNKQLESITKESQKLQQQVEKLNAEKLQIEKDKIKVDSELNWFKAKSQDEFNDKKIELESRRVELEALQLVDNNPNNDEIRNN